MKAPAEDFEKGKVHFDFQQRIMVNITGES